MKKYESLVGELRAMLPEYMAQKQIRVGTTKNGRPIHCLNPGHPDRHPSMRYDFTRNILHCFSCGVSYDLFQVIAMDYPICDSFPRQVKKACELFGREFPADFGVGEKILRPKLVVPAVGNGAAITAARQAPPAVESAPDFTGQVETELHTRGAGGAYFAARGIPPALCEKYGLYQTDERAVIPIYAGGRCICYCARSLDDQTKPRYKNSPGSMEIFGGDALTRMGGGSALFITEAALDALSAEICGFEAVALCGVGNVGKFLRLCAANPSAANSYTLIAAGDGDEAGAAMNQALKEGLRALGLECGELLLPDGYKDLNELLLADPAVLKSTLEAAAQGDNRRYAKSSAAGAIAELFDLSIRRGSRRAVSTGFLGLDRVLDGGLYAGLYIIGAISSLGKTSYVLQMADYIAGNETDVLFFSLEMSRIELMAKSISRMTYQLDPSANRTGGFTARQVLRFDLEMSAERGVLLNSAVAGYKQNAAGLFLREGMAEIGAGEIRSAVREHIRLRGVKPVVMVDYLQILTPHDPRASDKQNTDRSVVELKRISRDFDIPVVAISSFNRENYRNAVSMEAFKESGAVEYSSDVLLGMQLAGAGENGFDANAAKSRSPRAVELVMLKNRNGIPFAKIEYAYLAKYSYFVEGQQGKGKK